VSDVPTGPRPRFTIVSAVYNVSRYLDEFIAAIDAQTFDLSQVEVIMVDDGSTDDSYAILQAWQQRRPELVTAITKPNGGQGSARNLGTAHAHGEWITYPDPDDVVDRRYLAEVDAFLRERPTTMMIATNRVVFQHETREQSNHPLHKHFTKYNRLRNLNYDTGHFHGSAPCSFFRLDELRRQELLFDDRIRPTFEDGHFCSSYLLRVDKPLVGYLPTAVYNYRKRGDKSSTLDLSWADTGRFTNVPEFGFLALLQDGAQRNGGRPPTWLQGMVIYELSWYLKTSDLIYAQTTDDPVVMARFHDLMAQICDLLDDDALAGYDATRLKPELRDILRYGYVNKTWHTDYTYVDKLDMRQRTMRLCYRFTGPRPHEMFIVDGAHVEPFHEKVRDIKFFDKPVLHERIVWVPFGTVRVVLDGVDVSSRMAEPPMPAHFLDSWAIRTRLDPELPKPKAASRRKGRWSKDGAIRRLARTRVVRHYFGNAWVLMDRIIDADDSAEHLFRYLRKHRRNVNAWFVLERGTTDYRRLRKEKYLRVVPHGSLAWKLLMLNAQHLISSHIDHPIVKPEEIVALAPPKWRFVFLQHGVIKDDISNWLNGKNIDIFVTSTPGEQESIAGDHTAYRYTTREAHLTGLPRFDKVRAEGKKFPPDKRDLILVAPTWRQWLIEHTPTTDASRAVDPDEFRSSEYAAQWGAFLRSSELRETAERNGLTVAVLLHPNLRTALPLLDVDPSIEKLSFDGQNIQALFARARVVITDYSSMAFNAAYIDRPLVYFQFDRDRMFGGGHMGRSGYFEYERDGFGPVVLNAEDAIAAVTKAVANGPDPEPEYARRIAAAFPQRDGKCCERTANVIAASTKALEPRYADAEDRDTSETVDTPVGSEPAAIRQLATDNSTQVSAESVDQ
jgi:glycosyltransferase involved in cell wall biosynthesis/CDP-glycerol glycerophosphotransferase (TagB/SpsB family)